MKLREKTTATLLIAIFMISMMSFAVMAVKPTYDEVEYYQTQFQWRGCNSTVGSAFGAWSRIIGPGTSTTSSHMRQTEDVIHSYMEYSPTVFGNPRGMSHVYVYDGDSDWVLHEGKTSYTYEPFYGPYRVVNYFRGYVEFSDTPPSTSTFTWGVLYQWAYVMKPQKEPVPDVMEHAVWDPVMNAWLVGFSVYLQDPQQNTHTLPFPASGGIAELPRPVPANNYNPLGQ